MPLTDTKIRALELKDTPFKVFDERGLFLLVTPTGGKWWRFKYRCHGKEKQLSLGTYPDVPLKLARKRRDDAREQVASGIDPGEHRKAQKTAQTDRFANSFEVVAREWFGKYSKTWAKNHGPRVIRRLERDVFPYIGARPISDIHTPELLEAIRRIEERGVHETARRALATCGQIFRYAVQTGRAKQNPTTDARGALPPVKGGHFAAITEPKKVGELLRALDGYQGSLVVKCALKLAPLVFVRPGELRTAQWGDINLDTAEWRYTVSKTNTEHVVPLAKQAIGILKEIKGLTGNGQYVFPSGRSPRRPMSNNAILAAMRRMGIGKDEMSGHGFRAMARTIMDEVLGIRPDFIEHQLAHAVRDPNGRAYNRTAYLPERHKMMQQWADYLESLTATNVVPIRGVVAA